MTNNAPAREHNHLQKRQSATNADSAIAIWLICVAMLVFAMIIVGGATRLTDSGLSITEWLPILGVIPPLSDADWTIAFEKYKQIPEYEHVNKGMTIAEFKYIYWWEWAHRFLGRFIGLAFAMPLIIFWLLGKLRAGLAWKLLGIFALGGFQGAIGWYMVQSGLVDRVDVSHYRLALHLTTAFVIFACLVWLIRDLTAKKSEQDQIRTSSSEWITVLFIVAVIALQVVFGAFVAGLKAGLSNNTWPLMQGHLIPNDLWTLTPWIINFVENPTTVQFIHRGLAYTLLALSFFHLWNIWRNWQLASSPGHQAMLILTALLIQTAIGIWILLAAPAAGGIPINLGLVHQGGAAIVLALVVWHVHTLLQNRQTDRPQHNAR